MLPLIEYEHYGKQCVLSKELRASNDHHDEPNRIETERDELCRRRVPEIAERQRIQKRAVQVRNARAPHERSSPPARRSHAPNAVCCSASLVRCARERKLWPAREWSGVENLKARANTEVTEYTKEDKSQVAPLSSYPSFPPC